MSIKGLSQLISYLLHPVPVVLYGLLVVLFSQGAIYVPIEYKIYVIAIVMLSTAIVPALLLPLFKVMRVVDSYELLSARERVLPLVMSTMGYWFCAVRLTDLGYFPLADIFFISFALISMVEAFVSYFWKISLHAAAIAAMATFLLIFALFLDPEMMRWFILFILLWGVVSTTRLHIGRHNIWQIAAGTLLGVVMLLLVAQFY